MKLALGCRDDRVELLEVPALGGDLGGEDDPLRVTAAWAL